MATNGPIRQRVGDDRLRRATASISAPLFALSPTVRGAIGLSRFVQNERVRTGEGACFREVEPIPEVVGPEGLVPFAAVGNRLRRFPGIRLADEAIERDLDGRKLSQNGSFRQHRKVPGFT